MSKRILGISAFYHDSAAALLHDDEIVAAAQEERFSRTKHDSSFPSRAVEYCLEESSSGIDELDAVVFYEKPFRKFERLLETYYSYAPSGLRSFLSAIPVWIKEKLFQKRLIRNKLEEVGNYSREELNLLFTEHHQSHAASAFYPSPFEEAAVLTLDAVGEWATTTLGRGQGGNLEILRELQFPHSIGLLYSAFTSYLGFRVNAGEYKVMGLSSYGRTDSERVRDFKNRILEELVDLKPDGSFAVNQDYFRYATGLRMVNEGRWEELFGLDRRAPDADLKQEHADLARAIQDVTETIVLRLAETLREETGATKLCLAGGVALNCVANGRLLKEGIFEDLWVQPAAGDAGGALGAAYAVYHDYFDEPRERSTTSSTPDSRLKTPDSRLQTPDSGPPTPKDKMKGAYLGPDYSGTDVEQAARDFGASYEEYTDSRELLRTVTQKLKSGDVVGWFQGRMEWGPRALGSRSILADPRSNDMQQTVNRKVKYRETFRPFAPSVRVEEAREYFDLEAESPYMLLVAEVLEERLEELPDDYDELSLEEKNRIRRSDIPAVTHVDFTARLQTVHRETNRLFHELLGLFKEETGCGVLLNTSLNLSGEPIVRSPEEAYRCFMRSQMDTLVVEHYVFDREDQPEWPESLEESAPYD